ncbi:hypothetical protein ISF12_10920 [Pseudomonas aeruginosa]|nr:hypothetical protein [Pseudomonas aeruginosa]
MSDAYQFMRRERVALTKDGLREKGDDAPLYKGRTGRVVNNRQVPKSANSKEHLVYVKVRWNARDGEDEFLSEELESHLQIDVPMTKRLSREQFMGIMEEKNWDKRSLGHRWGYKSIRRVDQLINDEERPAYFDDALMNLPILKD